MIGRAGRGGEARITYLPPCIGASSRYASIRPARPAVPAWSAGSAGQAGACCCPGFADARQGWEGRQATAAESIAGEQGAAVMSDRGAEISPGALGLGLGVHRTYNCPGFADDRQG